MAHLNYEFDRKPLNPKRSPDRWSKQLRLTLLFLAVAAVTAAAIYALVPGKKVEPVKKTQEAITQENTSVEKKSAVKNIAPAATEKTVEKNTRAAASEAEKEIEKSVADSSKEVASVSSDPKGEVTAGDLPLDSDKPVLTGSASVEAVNKLKELLANGDLSGAAEVVGPVTS